MISSFFQRPAWLYLALALPAAVALGWHASLRRRRDAAAVGRPAMLAALRTPEVWGRQLGLAAYPLAWALLLLGVAGPRWGKGDEGGVAVGRDLVVVLDVSRSMLADDMAGPPPARCDVARLAALDLLDAAARKGGHRVGLVAFAARPKVICPLTTDSDHVRAAAEDLDPRLPPPECGPGNDPAAVSGTRIGAALAAAVALHDPRFPGAQDIVLLSDGDDPIDDREWQRGAAAARKANVPVHVVGLGDPDRDGEIPLGDGFLDFVPKEGDKVETVRSRLHEDPLRAIAEETRGLYLPARRAAPDLGEFFRAQIAPRPSREVSDDALPQPRERYAWLLAPALALFLIGWVRGK